MFQRQGAAVTLDWHRARGFLVVDLHVASEGLVQEVGQYLARSRWAVASHWADEPVSALGLSPRAECLMCFLRISTVGELLSLSSRDLFEWTFRPVAVQD